MVELEKTITIQAPAEQIFRYIDNPENFPKFWPSVLEITDIRPMSMGGKRFSWVYRMMGVRFQGYSEDIEYKFGQRLICQTRGGIHSTFSWQFTPVDGATRLDLKVEYRVPIPLLGRLAEFLVVSQNENEAETLLNNLKVLLDEEREAV